MGENWISGRRHVTTEAKFPWLEPLISHNWSITKTAFFVARRRDHRFSRRAADPRHRVPALGHRGPDHQRDRRRLRRLQEGGSWRPRRRSFQSFAHRERGCCAITTTTTTTTTPQQPQIQHHQQRHRTQKEHQCRATFSSCKMHSMCLLSNRLWQNRQSRPLSTFSSFKTHFSPIFGL